MQIQIVYSICVEKSCKKSTEDFLLNVESIGNEVRTSFIQKCVENPNRFDERIKKDKIHNFATESAKHKVREAEGKITEATMIRDLFGSMLRLSMQQKVDMADVLKYPLTPVSLCLRHIDGSVNSNPKSNLQNYIDSHFLQFHRHQPMEL